MTSTISPTLLLSVVLSSFAGASDPLPREAQLELGAWRAWLDCPGGPIPFGLELSAVEDELRGSIRNGDERLPIARVEQEGESLVLHLDPYDSRIRARISEDGQRLEGEWERYRGPDRWTRMAFYATAGNAPRFPLVASMVAGDAKAVLGRWAVQFADSEDGSVAVFESYASESGAQGGVQGTFLTTLGDYRFLEGRFDGAELALSCFDGAHAFLFKARLEGGELRGDFWSRDTWHEEWTAVRDPDAALADPFELTRWTGSKALSEVAFPDLDGQLRTLDDPTFVGKARILVLFGTWCPNCYDASTYLRELDERFGDAGLEILGLAFEFGDTFERNAKVVREYAEHKGVTYPILVAGPSDKKGASAAFPLLDRVRAYPTFVFLDAEGSPRSIYTGFSGPATGEAHERLREQFERTILGILAEK